MPRVRDSKRAVCFASCCQAGTGPRPQGLEWHLPELPKWSFPAGTPLAAMSQSSLPDIARGAMQLLRLGGGDTASPGNRLKSALQTCASSPDWKQAVLGIVQFGGLIGAAGQLLSPTGPGGCDHNALERCANCATSVPYVLVGIHAMQHRKTTAGKMWGASMCAVGMASTTFHASSGKWRTIGRRMDYWSIALASNIMARAVYPGIPAPLTAAGIALTPFKPFLVSFLNSAAMELKFLHRAHQRPELRPAQRLHAITCLAGLGAFALEEVFPRLPLVHSAWHCLSATSVASVNNLLADVEDHNASRAAQQHRRDVPLLTSTCTTLAMA